MANEYRKLMQAVEPPAGLQERVLRSARNRNRRQGFPLLRTAVCAACGLALAAGTVTWERSVPAVPRLSVGLTAQAAESVNGGMVFRAEELCFQIVSEGAERVRLSADSGTLWRGETCLGQEAEEGFDPVAVYRLAPEEQAALTLTAIGSDGGAESRRFYLSAEQLRMTRAEDGQEVRLLALPGETAETEAGLFLATEESCRFLWPVEGASTVSLSNRYGSRERPGGTVFHAGMDIPAPEGTMVLAAAAGTVLETGFDPERGNYLVLDHDGGLTTTYAHCREVSVEKGDCPAAGEPVAVVGSTGMSTGPHLCFQVRQDGVPQDPAAFFSAEVRNNLRMG